jgi:two-component sensor histidine kinase
MHFATGISARLLFFVLSILASLGSGAQQAFLKHYTTKDGLPANAIYNIFQDHRGFLWFCSEQGVSQFDGHRFRTFSQKEGLPDNEVFSMAEDEFERKWLVVYNHVPCYIKDDKVFTPQNDSLCRMIARAGIAYTNIYKGKGGKTILVGSGFCSLSRDSITIRFAEHTASLALQHYFLNGESELLLRANALSIVKEEKIVDIYNGSFYNGFFRNDKLILFENKGGSFWLHQLRLAGDKVLEARKMPAPSFIYGFYQESDTTVLCMTIKGVYTYHLLSGHLHRSSPVSAALTVNRMLQDHEGNNWYSTPNDGVYMHPRFRPYVFNTTAGLRDNNVIAVQLPPDGSIIATHSDGSFERILGKELSRYELPLSNMMNRVKFVHPLSPGSFLAGSDRGLYLMKGTSTTQLWSDAQKASILGHGYILIGAATNLVRFDLTTQTIRKICDKRTTALGQDDNGMIYIGSTDGMYTYSQVLRKFNMDSTLSKSRITSIARTSDNRMVFATHTAGLYIWDHQQLHHLDEQDGLSSNNCRKVLVGPDGLLWVYTDRGLDMISLSMGKIAQAQHCFWADGILSNNINDIAVDSSRIYAATSEGIIVLPAWIDEGGLLPPRIYISGVLTRDTTLHYPGFVSLSYAQNDLQISYSGISFSSGPNLQYRYVLRGVSNDTVYTQLSAINLSAIEPGDYEFIVWAGTAGKGLWSTVPARFSFSISPPFWRQLWFLTIVLISLALGVYLLYRRKVQQIHRAAQEKSERVKQIAQLEMQALRAQINPHFIFNALSAIQDFYSQNDERKANHYLTLFAQLIRKTLHHSNTHWLTLTEELSMLNAYIELEQMRFNYAFEYEIILSEDIRPDLVRIPAMLIQPYVENAVNHGLRTLHEGKGRLTLRFDLQADRSLICLVEDNGVGIAKAVKKPLSGPRSMGMSISRQRIETINQTFGTRITVSVTDRSSLDSALQGTIILLSLNAPKDHEPY